MNRVILLVLLLILAAIPAYFFVFGVIAVCRKIQHYPQSSVKHKIAVLIPARNEEMVIGNLIQSLMEQNYPKDAYEVYALVNHCTDHTEKTALQNGAKVIHCEDSYTKGEVLQVTFDQLVQDESIEAYVVMDADNLADPDFLTRMNDAYSAGNDLIQGRRTGKNVTNWISKCYEAFYIMQNIYFNHARASVGDSASFNGTAWLISRSYLRKHGYQTYSITEDIELMAIAAMQDEKVAYVHDAVVYDEYPQKLKVSACQLDRWIFGQVQCMRIYSHKLFVSFFKRHYEPCLDMGLIFTMPVFIQIAVIVLILWLCSSPAAAAIFFAYLGWILLGLYVFMILMISAAILKNGSSLKYLFSGVLCFPVFVLIWLVLMPGNLFRRKMDWKPVKHDVSKRIEDMK